MHIIKITDARIKRNIPPSTNFALKLILAKDAPEMCKGFFHDF
jgi:hypothetical protein